MPWEKIDSVDYRRLARNLQGKIANCQRMSEILLLSSKGKMKAQKYGKKATAATVTL